MASGAHSSNLPGGAQAVAVTALLAVLLALALPHIPGGPWWLLCALLLSTSVVWMPGRSGICGALRGVRTLIGLLAVACASLALTAAELQHWQGLRWPPAVIEKQRVEAIISGIPIRSGADVELLALVRPVSGGAWRRVQVRWRNAPEVHAAQRWQWLLELRAAHGTLNPGARDAEREFLRQRIHALGTVRDSPLNRLLAQGQGLDRWRERIGTRIRTVVAERDSAALLMALAIGDTQRISAEQWRVFNACGITHLVAISGLHITLFCLLMARGIRWLWRCWPWLQRRCAADRCALLAGWSCSAGYALLAGWSVPTQRTLLMLAAWHGARLLRRVPGAVPAWSLALLAVLLLDPLAPLSAGFWLSFLAVAMLIAGGALRDTSARTHGDGDELRTTYRIGARVARCGALLRELLRTQWRISLALIPCTLAIFASFAPLSLLVNLVAIPFFSLLLVPLLLLACVLDAVPNALGAALLQLAAQCAQCSWPLLQAVADVDWASLPLAVPWWWYALAVPALLLLLAPCHWRLKLGAALLPLPLLAPRATQLLPGECRVTVLDVGRGEAIVVRTATHTLLFDDGESWNTAGRIGAGPVLAALRGWSRRRIDLLVLPALDADRAEGVAALQAALAVPRKLAVQRAGAALVPEYGVCAPLGWSWDAVRFELLAVDGVCALQITVAGRRVLIGGQLQAGAWSRLDLSGAPVAALIAPRHGSDAALAGVLPGAAPRWVLISQPWQPRPSRVLAAAVAQWRSHGSEVHLSGEEGALELRLQPGGAPELLSERAQRGARPWR
ncbi:MAG: ComEC/Rec2 family competence protein [Steroidobacteraceae bacterium]